MFDPALAPEQESRGIDPASADTEGQDASESPLDPDEEEALLADQQEEADGGEVRRTGVGRDGEEERVQEAEEE